MNGAWVEVKNPGETRIIEDLVEIERMWGGKAPKKVDSRPPVELLSQAEAMAIGGGWQTVPLTDLETGLTFNISWHPLVSCHTDWLPMSPDDVRIIQEILHPGRVDTINWSLPSSWSWNACPGIIEVDGQRIAVGFHLFPHGIREKYE